MPGHGLGLSAVAAIADLHRETITLLDNGPGLRLVMMFPGSLITKPYRLGDAAPTRAPILMAHHRTVRAMRHGWSTGVAEDVV